MKIYNSKSSDDSDDDGGIFIGNSPDLDLPPGIIPPQPDTPDERDRVKEKLK
ncbi:MAG: hypothetical protein LAT68_13455 [Cyclobacteriaceae bacterium]|nr:hypothetical protein [Cyclobacteriaceae bacterium]MCH8517326.1 hypothetical protein [Cyclobacteriaceae bacterium]